MLFPEDLIALLSSNGLVPTNIFIYPHSCTFKLRDTNYYVDERAAIDIGLYDGTHSVFTGRVIANIDMTRDYYTCWNDQGFFKVSYYEMSAKEIEFTEHCRRIYDCVEKGDRFHHGDIFYISYACGRYVFQLIATIPVSGQVFYTLDELHEYISANFPAAIKWSTANILQFVD